MVLLTHGCHLVTQANSASPCESVTQVIMNTTNSVAVQNTIGVITNIMGVLGGDMLPQGFRWNRQFQSQKPLIIQLKRRR